MLTLRWTQAPGPTWYRLEGTNFGSLDVGGVYVIYAGGTIATVPLCVDVGQGDIADRLYNHQRDPNILSYRTRGTLRVTWAAVPVLYRDGVERYLAETLQPLAGRRYPDVVPIPVNLPAVA